jgi:hypothetical protein
LPDAFILSILTILLSRPSDFLDISALLQISAKDGPVAGILLSTFTNRQRNNSGGRASRKKTGKHVRFLSGLKTQEQLS